MVYGDYIFEFRYIFDFRDALWVIKIFALKNFIINKHQNVSRAFNILHYVTFR